MKKTLKNIILLTALSNVSYSASIDYLMNQSPAYLGNPSQNAMISVDGAIYNPAGIVHLEDGKYLQFGNQFGFIHESMSTLGDDYDSDTFEPAIPSIVYVNKHDNKATYFTLGVIGGGASLEYDDGVPGAGKIPSLLHQIGLKGAYMKDSAFEGSNNYFGATLGRAWALDDKWSVSAAGRLVYASRSIEGYAEYDGIPDSIAPKKDFDIDSERTAWGVGGIFGINYKPNDKWNFAGRYETKVKLKFEADAKSNDAKILGNDLGFLDFYPMYADGDKRYRDLPANLGFGISYKVTEKLMIMTGGNYYFIENADLDGMSGYDNGYEVNIGMEYTINEKWSWTLGYNHAETGASSETYSDIEYALDSSILGTGIKYRPEEDREWLFSVANISYKSATAAEKDESLGEIPVEVTFPAIKYEKSFLAFGVSYTMKF